MELGDGVCGSCGASHHITSPHEYNYSEVLDQNLICEICAEPLVDPVDLPCCHTFCKLCIDTCMVTGNRFCPLDRIPLQKFQITKTSLKLRNIVNQLKVTCNFCPETMVRENLTKHISVFCLSAPVHCLFYTNGCSVVLARQLLKEHCKMCKYKDGPSMVTTVSNLIYNCGYLMFMVVSWPLRYVGRARNKCVTR